MSESQVRNTEDRKTGTVDRIVRDYGFITSAEVPDRDIYFKVTWFRGAPPLREGDPVTFALRTFGDNVQAFQIDRADQPEQELSYRQPRMHGRPPIGYHIFDWAYLGYVPDTLRQLQALALSERWEFKNAAPNPERPAPILFDYLLHTFGRLVMERKVLVNDASSFAAFNTGLVDHRYETIYALFSQNDNPRVQWQLSGFCIAGEGVAGQNLVRHFNPLPASAHYFDNAVDLLYDTRAGKPELDWRHIIIERIDRYPKEFVDDHWPPSFEARDTSVMTDDDRNAYHVALGEAIEQDNRTYRRIMNRVKDAIDLSIKRVAWNFKTAVPQYYPRVRHLQLLLPMCLVSDEHVDMALAVEKTPSGTYLGHTVLPLDWAYQNARLVCRPDSDWLAPEEISESGEGEQESEST